MFLMLHVCASSSPEDGKEGCLPIRSVIISGIHDHGALFAGLSWEELFLFSLLEETKTLICHYMIVFI